MQLGCFSNCPPVVAHDANGWFIGVGGLLAFMLLTLLIGAIWRRGPELLEQDRQDNARRDQWEQAFREWRGH